MIDTPIPTATPIDEAQFLVIGGALSLYAFLTMRKRRKDDPKAKLPTVLYVLLVLGLLTFLCGVFLVVT
jgi:hypothetical protein